MVEGNGDRDRRASEPYGASARGNLAAVEVRPGPPGPAEYALRLTVAFTRNDRGEPIPDLRDLHRQVEALIREALAAEWKGLQEEIGRIAAERDEALGTQALATERLQRAARRALATLQGTCCPKPWQASSPLADLEAAVVASEPVARI